MFSLYQKLTTVRDSSAHLNKQLSSRNTCLEIQRKYVAHFGTWLIQALNLMLMA